MFIDGLIDLFRSEKKKSWGERYIEKHANDVKIPPVPPRKPKRLPEDEYNEPPTPGGWE